MAKYTIQGKGEVNLTDKNFITEGGEGKIYGKGSTIYKIYADLHKMIPEAKIRELGVLSRDNILNPQNIIFDSKSRMVGFTMNRIENSIPICKLFTTDYRNRNGIAPENVVNLVDNIQETLNFIHDKKILVVDGNELNYLVKEKAFEIPYFIDVDSYQTANFPATAIMPNIRDYNTNGFNRLTDWYSFAIIAFQLFIGIHPFKGKHPSFKKNSLVERMKKNVSVFNKDVRVPASIRDFSHIPSHYMGWFERLFEKGERIPPPVVAGLLNVAQVQTEVIDSTDNFIIKFLTDYKNPVTSYFYHGGHETVTTTEEGWIGKVNYKVDCPNCEIVYTDKFMTPIVASIENDLLVLKKLKTGEIVPNVYVNAKKMTKVNNSLVAWGEEKVAVISLEDKGENILASIGPSNTYNVMPNSTQMFDGFLYNTLLEKPYLLLPKVNGGDVSFFPKQIPELEKYKIIDGKFEGNTLIIIGYKNNGYDRLVFSFDEPRNKYVVKKDEDIYGRAVNFTVLGNGIVVNIPDDGVLEIFKDGNISSMKIIKDPIVGSDMKLCNNGLDVLFYRGNELYSLKMK